MKILIIAEYDNQALKNSTLSTLTAALELNAKEIDLLVFGENCASAIASAKELSGLSRILVLENACYANQLAENSAQLIATLGKHYNYILMGATTFGKNILPRVAALLDVSMLSDVVKIISPDTFVRPIYAGNALVTVQTEEAIKVLSVRPTAFTKTQTNSTASVDVENLANQNELIFTNSLSQFENQALTKSSRPDLASARIVVSGGRGLKSAENFKQLEEIADVLGAAVGASRAAVDAGFAPNDYQVGQTGKVVAPDLYIAVGISGAIQHLAGMKDSKVIVAINNDPDAPIYEIANYGLVGDLFTLLPQLRAELEK